MLRVALVMQAAAAVAAPQSAPLPATLPDLIVTAGYQANVARLFAALPADVFTRCPTLRSTGSQVTVIEPPSFEAGYPVSGKWRQRFPVSGCGNDTTINLFFSGGPGGRISSTVALPGATRADPVLQHDAYRLVAIAVQAKAAAGCGAIHVRDTRDEDTVPAPIAPGIGKATAPSWRETWVVAACGKALAVPVTFVPDATGTSTLVGTVTEWSAG